MKTKDVKKTEKNTKTELPTTYQEDCSLRKIAINMITDILREASKLMIIKPLVGVKITHNAKSFSGKMLLNLTQFEHNENNYEKKKIKFVSVSIVESSNKGNRLYN